MDQGVKRIYCGANQIICSLGDSTENVVDAICHYETNLRQFKDGTTIYLIDKQNIDTSNLEDYTFTEQLAICAIRDVIKKSGVALNSARTALVISTTKGNIDCIKSDFQRSFLHVMGNKIANYFEYKKTPIIVANACISGITAIGVASRMIEQDEIDNAFVVGVDTINDFVVSGFNSFKSISPSVCRPYDANRDGLTAGEGCGVLLLTNKKDLSSYNIELSGYAMTDDACHISAPSRTGDGLFYAIDKAMKNAGVEKNDIAFINAHGTATLYNDEMESRAIHWAELDNVPCNSLKPYIGHTFGASGVIETILSIEAMARNIVFGVKGYEISGVPFPLNISSKHRTTNVNHCLKTASGFGGTNAAIVLSKVNDSKRRVIKNIDCEISECAKISLKSKGGTASEELKTEYKDLADVNLKFYKMSNLSKLGYVASCKMLKGIELPFEHDRVAVILASRSSSLDTDLIHQKNVDKNIQEEVSPAIFVYTLANIVAAEIAIKHKFQGESTTFIMENKDMDFLKKYARLRILQDECDAVVYGWCELLKNDYEVELKLITKNGNS